MPRRPTRKTKTTRPRSSGTKRRRRFDLGWTIPGAKTRRRLLRAFREAPLSVQLAASVSLLVVIWFLVNGVYQVARKPTELFFPLSGALYRTPAQTWATYGALFRRHATPIMTAELLAALAQVEGSGNPLVRTYWRWSLMHDPFEVYRPASSAVGMYQITDATFLEARRYCIRNHRVVEEGPWSDLRSCWFNALYTRIIPSHAVEMTSAYLDRRVTHILLRRGMPSATLRQKQELAAVVHLCGAGAGARFAAHGLRPRAGQRCGDHDVRAYLGKLERMKRLFAQLNR
jgi:hypothetical protein